MAITMATATAGKRRRAGPDAGMPRRRLFPERSLREWAVRGVLAAAAAAAGGFSVAHTLAQMQINNRPALAHRLAPWDGRITAALAGSLAGADANLDGRARADALARQALQQDPTAVVAASTLGIDAEVRGDRAAASRFFSYAEKLSRRDLQTQLWNIETAVAQGDVNAALRHYDIALRTKAQSWDLLFPILAAASSDAQVRAPLVRMLAGKPLWTEPFIGYVAANPPDPHTASVLFLELRRAGVPVPATAHAGTIDALLGGGFADEAWHHYAAIHRGADARRSRDPRFADVGDAPTPFDWTAINEGGVSTSIQRGEGGGIFEFSAPASIGGPLLRQIQMLPPGKYRLTGHGSGIEQPPASRPYWVLLCRADGRELARVVLPASSQDGGNFDGSMVVPGGCPVQMLTLVARASDAVSGLTGQIDRVELAPAP